MTGCTLTETAAVCVAAPPQPATGAASPAQWAAAVLLVGLAVSVTRLFARKEGHQ